MGAQAELALNRDFRALARPLQSLEGGEYMSQQVYKRVRMVDKIRGMVDFENNFTRISVSKTVSKADPLELFDQMEEIENESREAFEHFATNVSSLKINLPSSVLFRRS